MDLHAQCEYFLHWHRPRPAAERLRELAEYAGTAPADVYGRGAFLQDFEQQVADALGKPAGLFVISGVMAQQIALRIWTQRAGCTTIGLHPTSHLEHNEHRAYAAVHGLQAHRLGTPQQPVGLAHLQACAEPLGAVLLELPQRHLGGVLPAWEELGAMTAYCRARGIYLHMDGARLWECAPYYQQSYAALCADFDSVYVSFYKILGAYSGALLAGPQDFIDQARIWLRRLGGNLYQVHPYALSARRAFETGLPRIAELYDYAQTLARGLRDVPGIRLLPDPPHTTMMHLALAGELPALQAARDTLAREDRVWLLGPMRVSDVPGWVRAELYPTLDALALDVERAVSLFAKLMALARDGA